MKKLLLTIFAYVLFLVSTYAQQEDTYILTAEQPIDTAKVIENAQPIKPEQAIDTLVVKSAIDTLADTLLTPHFEPPTPYLKPMNGKEYWYNMWSSPRFKKTAFQRDSLYLMAMYLKKDTAAKADTILSLKAKNEIEKNRYAQLQKEHGDLKVNAARTASQLTGTIDEQNKQLIERESKINDMSDALTQREAKINDMSTALEQREAKIIDLENQLKRQDSLANALNNALKEALNNFKSDDLKLEMKNGKVYVSLFDKLLFKSGRANVEQAGKEALQKLAEVLNINANIDIMVEGHTDSIPIKTEKYPDNWELSTARSLNIVRLLTQSYNVDPKKVKVSAHAEFSPLVSNATSAGRAKNRRTEIILTPNLGTIYNMINTK